MALVPLAAQAEQAAMEQMEPRAPVRLLGMDLGRGLAYQVRMERTAGTEGMEAKAATAPLQVLEAPVDRRAAKAMEDPVVLAPLDMAMVTLAPPVYPGRLAHLEIAAWSCPDNWQYKLALARPLLEWMVQG